MLREHDRVVDSSVIRVNDPEATAWFRSLAADLIGEEAVQDLAAPIMGAEDFSHVLQRVRGLMAFVGARPAAEDPPTAPQNHPNRVIFEEARWPSGSRSTQPRRSTTSGRDARADHTVGATCSDS